MSTQYIFTMYKLSRVHPPDRRCWRTSRCRFLPGAKIGVLGAERRRASPPCCASWPAWTRTSAARRSSRPAPRSACSSRSRSSTRRRTCAATSRTACARCATCSTASTSWRPALRRDRRRVRRLQDAHRGRGRLGPRHHARDRDGRAAAAARRRRRGQRSPAASAAAWRSAGCCSRRRTCCCSTSPPTTSTPSRWPGSSATWRTTRAPWSR